VLEEQDHDGPEIQSPSANTDLNRSNSICQSVESILAEEEPNEDVLITLHKLVKQASRVSSLATLKEIMILTAAAGYVQLRQKWQSATGRKHRKPAQAASLAVAHRMGKGPAFACKIRETVAYITQFRRLPESHRLKKGGARSLLHNEAVVMGVRWHLAEQGLGEV